MEIKVKLEGKVLEKIRKADALVVGIFQKSMSDASIAVMEASIRETPASTGNLRKSIVRELSGNGLEARIYPSVLYGEVLHGPFKGGASHTSPFVIPAREAQPGGTLYRWAKKKGMNPWAVRASIKRKGIKRNPYLKRAAENSEGAVQRIFENAIKEVATHLAD